MTTRQSWHIICGGLCNAYNESTMEMFEKHETLTNIEWYGNRSRSYLNQLQCNFIWVNLYFIFSFYVDTMGFTKSLLLIQIYAVIAADASECMAVQQDETLNDWACQPFDHQDVDITNLSYHHCSLTCFQHQKCQAFIYDKVTGTCLVMDYICVWPRPNMGNIYGISKPQCFRWEPHGTDHPFYWFIESGNLKCFTGRRPHQDDMLVGKVTNNFYTIDPSSSSIISGGTYEKLVVDPSCEVTWVPHDANSGQQLPSDALIGGVLSDTNTPLYAVRQQVSGKLFMSYYNPLNNKAWGEASSSVRSTAVFEVMTIKHQW